MQCRGTVGDLGNQIHASLELVAKRRHDNGADDRAGIVREDTPHQVRAGNAREANFLVTGDAYLANRIRAVSAVAL